MLHLDDVRYAKLRSRRKTLSNGADDRVTGQNTVRLNASAAGQTAGAYNHVGNAYSRYADGVGIAEPSAPGNRFAHADAIVWNAVRGSLDELRKAGMSAVRVLDAGCGPGMWTKRIAE